MRHRNGGIYQAYINQEVQFPVQLAFWGEPAPEAVLKAATHMSRYVDPRAPNGLNEQQKGAVVDADPEICNIKTLEDDTRTLLIQQFGSLKNAKAQCSPLFRDYEGYQRKRYALRKRLLREAEQTAREKYFDEIDDVEIMKQLDPSFPDNYEEWQPPEVEHYLPERKLVVDIMNEAAKETDEDKTQHRIRLSDALFVLGGKRDLPLWLRQTKHKSSNVDAASNRGAEGYPDSYSPLHCIFCFFDQGRSLQEKHHRFSSTYKVRDHILRYHMKSNFKCPDSQCDKVFAEKRSLVGHMAKDHSYDVFRGRGDIISTVVDDDDDDIVGAQAKSVAEGVVPCSRKSEVEVAEDEIRALRLGNYCSVF
jgi:hypothetical protein